jgi:DNA-binding transcriptional LysR family regulator
MRSELLQDTALRYFAEVARSGSLTEASERLHVASSALSRQIAGLEQRMGCALFERHPRGMVLTAAGEVLARHARHAALDAERALEDIAALQGLRSGRVRIATSDAFASEFLPRLCAQFQGSHQGIRFDIQVWPTPQVPERLRLGEADIGLCFSRAPAPGVAVVCRLPAPVVALVPPGHALATQRNTTLAELSRHPLGLPPADTAVRQILDMACSRQGLLLEPVIESNHAQTLLRFVAEGGGLAVGSEIAARHLQATGALHVLPLRDQGMELRDIEVQTLAGRHLPHAAQSFLALLQQRLPAQ